MIRQQRRARELTGELVARLAAGELTVPVEQFDLTDAALAMERLRVGKVRGRAVLTPNGRLP
jgi:D-arabinose 1-dehydrogenase-like Zn-dependent alcohol dehydrogenase